MMVMVRVMVVVRIMNGLAAMQHLQETGTPELSCRRCCIPPAHRRVHVADDIKKRCRWNFDKLNALLLIFMILVIDVTQVLLMSDEQTVVLLWKGDELMWVDSLLWRRGYWYLHKGNTLDRGGWRRERS